MTLEKGTFHPAMRLLLVLGSAVTRYRYTEPCELGDAGESQAGPGVLGLVAASSGGWLHDKEWTIESNNGPYYMHVYIIFMNINGS